MARVYLSLGSNVEPQRYLCEALDELQAHFGKLDISPAYRNAAVGFEGADFINLAVGMDTDLGPVELHDWLHALEDRHGRRRDVPRYADRTIDVDIVLYDDLVVQGPAHLDIPRKELKYAFVLKPMADIASAVRHPVSGTTLGEMWADFPMDREPLTVVNLAAPSSKA